MAFRISGHKDGRGTKPPEVDMETLRIAGRRYSDPDILSLAKESGELIDPRFTIVNKVRLLVRKLDRFPGVPNDGLERLKILA